VPARPWHTWRRALSLPKLCDTSTSRLRQERLVSSGLGRRGPATGNRGLRLISSGFGTLLSLTTTARTWCFCLVESFGVSWRALERSSVYGDDLVGLGDESTCQEECVRGLMGQPAIP
jgi:hypothetical protein